jgi:FimV-like protein
MRPEGCRRSIKSAMAFAVGRTDGVRVWQCISRSLLLSVLLGVCCCRISTVKRIKMLVLTAVASASIGARYRLALRLTTRQFAFASLLVISAAATAGSLGQLTLQSALGESLRAEINVVGLRPGEAETLSAKIASPEAFREAGVAFVPSISTLRASIQRREGNYYVVLTSTQPINEPFLDVVVELNWATGRLARQYTFLLNSVENKGPNAPLAVASVEAKPVVPSKTPEPAPVPVPAKTSEVAPMPITPPPAAEAPPAPMGEAAPRPAPPSPAPGAAGAGGTYEVVKGDTLSEIARANLAEGISLNQMLVALYRANEGAFINNNMNLVRAGAKLTIPSKEDAIAVASEEATKFVSAQAQQFDRYRGHLATAVAMAPAREAPSQPATGRIEAAAPAPSAPKGLTEDQLRLSGAEPTSKAGKTAARGDDLTALKRELKEERERVSQLEQNVKDMERLLELKNRQLAELQKQAAAASAAPVMVVAAPQPVETSPVPRPASPPPSGKQRDHRYSEQRDRERSDTRARAQFADRERVIVREYYAQEYERGHCPPGLARKDNGCMPLDRAKKWRIGRPLPREVIFYDLPPSLVEEIGVPPPGYRYVRVASDVLMIAAGTGMVADAIENLGRI